MSSKMVKKKEEEESSPIDGATSLKKEEESSPIDAPISLREIALKSPPVPPLAYARICVIIPLTPSTETQFNITAGILTKPTHSRLPAPQISAKHLDYSIFISKLEAFLEENKLPGPNTIWWVHLLHWEFPVVGKQVAVTDQKSFESFVEKMFGHAEVYQRGLPEVELPLTGDIGLDPSGEMDGTLVVIEDSEELDELFEASGGGY